MLTAIKSIKRTLVILREEEQSAEQNEKPEIDEFDRLD
jgi:hypothetical protein